MILLRLFFILHFVNALYLYFDRESYEIYISESTLISTKIGFVKVISSPSLSIHYELHGDTNKTFHLNSLTGELVLLTPVDYETIPIYKLTIEARSSSSSTIAPCFSELIIHILNTNDNPPDINLIIYPSVLYEFEIIKYDSHLSSTPFATINIKDLDESTKQLSLSLNDTEHFQTQLIRQLPTDVIYILSTKANVRLIDQDYYYLLLTSCDNDQPSLCTNQSYKFHMKSNEYLCNLSFNQPNYILDVKEDLPTGTLLMHKITNQFCEHLMYSIDDTARFSIDSQTGDLFVRRKFYRIEQSIHIIHLFINNQFKVKIFIRILDQDGKIPFLINKNLISKRKEFSFVRIFNSTFCRYQPMIENYFQLLSNCTIVTLIKPPPAGRYLFNVELIEQVNFHDTFVLELLDDEEQHISMFTQTQWIAIIPIILSILVVIGIVIVGMMIMKQKQYHFNQLCSDKQKASSLTSNNDEKSRYNKYDVLSSIANLKVHDDYELSPSSTNTPIYIIQKSSPPLSSLSPARDDEGYSGSSDVSENHLPFESTIISGNGLLEQYHIHQFPSQQPLYDVPRRSNDRMNVSGISPGVTLV